MIYVSLLRGINVSGKNPIPMAGLKQSCEALGFTDVSTYVQSGNVLFDTAEGAEDALAQRIESRIKADFGWDVPVLVRTAADICRLLAGNPFLPARQEQTEFLHVTFLSRRPDAAGLAKLDAVPQSEDIPPEGDAFILEEREVYLFCPGGYGRTKFNNTFFETKLGLPATTRNWKTVKALAAMAAVGSP